MLVLASIAGSQRLAKPTELIMKRKFVPLIAVAALVTSSEAALLYHYAFETGDPTVNSGSGANVATAQGSLDSGVAGGASGFFGDFGGGNSASSDALDLTVTSDAIALNAFELSFSVNETAHTNYDDYLSFTTSSGDHFAFETFPDGTLLVLNVAAGGGNGGNVPSSVDTSDGTWRSIRFVGSAGIDPADATTALFIDDVLIGTNQLTGGATQTIADLRVGGRVGVDNRYVSAGIDEVKLSSVPEPSSVVLLGLGGCAFILRRRK